MTAEEMNVWHCTECGGALLGGEAVIEDPIGSQEYRHSDCRDCEGCSCSGDPEANHGCGYSPDCNHNDPEPRATMAYEYP